MNNGTTKEVIAQFDQIASLPDTWDHNRQYQTLLLRRIPKTAEKGLDIGCGTGEFTKKFSLCCHDVIGIDISKRMVEEAVKRNMGFNITFLNRDIGQYLYETNDKFDVIVSIATFHHLDTERVFRLVREKLNEGGALLVLDLYKPDTLLEHLLSIIATICNPFFYLIKRGTFFNAKEEQEAWEKHGQYDAYNTLTEIRIMALRTLGKVKIRRHLFWRYSLVYINNNM